MSGDGAFVACIVAIVVVLPLALGFGIPPISRHYDEVNCRGFGVSAGRDVKFVDYSYFSWACLTPTADGKWIETSNLREI